MNEKNFRRQQWKMLFVTMFCYLFFYTGRHNFGWAVKGMSEELLINFEQIGWISFSMLIGYAIGQLINGNLADRLSPKIMILCGGMLSFSCNLMISFATNYTSVLVLWTLNGYFQSMAWGSGSKLISNWWSKEESGRAFGFYTMAAGSSSVLTFLLALLMVNQNQSWRALFRYPVLFLLAALIVFLFIAKSKPKISHETEPTSDKQRRFYGWSGNYKAVLGNRNFLIASLAIGFESMARYGLIFWVPIHFLGNNYKSNTINLWLTILIPIGMAIGAISFSYISDFAFRKNRSRSIAAGMIISAVIAVFIYYAPITNQIQVSILMFAAGFFVYGPQANFWTLNRELLGTRLVGTGTGVMNMSAYTFAAIGEPIFGKIIDYTGKTENIFIVVAIICVLCALTISFVQQNQRPLAPCNRCT